MDLTFFPARAKWRSSQSPRRGVPWLCLTGADIVRDGVKSPWRIIASTMSRTIESLCTKCGAPTEAGLIFCKKCGAALGLTDPLIRPLSQTETGKFLSWQWVVLA